MGKNIAVQQTLERLLYQVTIKKRSLNRMDIIQPHSRLSKCSQCNQRKMHYMDPPGILHAICIECELNIKPCFKCGEKPRLPGQSRCRDCWNEQKRANYKKHPRKPRNRKPGLNQDRQLRFNYNISKEDYDLMLLRQGGVCAICGNAETKIHPRGGEVQSLCVDHNHETGQVRELLCHKCNWILGYIERDRNQIKKFLKYLKKHDT